MREIRFRVYYPASEDGLLRPLMGFFDRANLHELPWDEGLEIMQYTGLKDKTGREIYEGDIVDTHDIVCHGEYWNGLQYEDCDSGYGWYLRSSHDRVGDGWGIHHIDAYEVIGNIYENPELLEGGDNG